MSCCKVMLSSVPLSRPRFLFLRGWQQCASVLFPKLSYVCIGVVACQSRCGAPTFLSTDAFGLYGNCQSCRRRGRARERETSDYFTAIFRFIYEQPWSTMTCGWSGSYNASARGFTFSRASVSTSCSVGTMGETKSWLSLFWTSSRRRTVRCASCSSKPLRRKMSRLKFQPVSLGVSVLCPLRRHSMKSDTLYSPNNVISVMPRDTNSFVSTKTNKKAKFLNMTAGNFHW